jgi:hypothetical protein
MGSGISSEWFYEGILYIPTQTKSAPNNMSRNMKKFAQFCKTGGFTVHGKNPIVSFISTLLNECFPSAVIWFVVSIVVLPAECQTGGRLSHVFIKVNKVEPAFAYFYTSPPIIEPVFVIWVKTTFHHSQPNAVKSGFCLPMTIPPPSIFPERTAARYDFSNNKIAVSGNCFVSTIADAVGVTPGSAGFFSGRSFRNNKELAESHSDDMFFSRHNFGYFNFMFSGGCRVDTGGRCELS